MNGKGVEAVEPPGIEEACVFGDPIVMLAGKTFPGKLCVVVFRRTEGAGVEDDDDFVAKQLEALGVAVEKFTDYCVRGHIVLVCRELKAASAVQQMFFGRPACPYTSTSRALYVRS